MTSLRSTENGKNDSDDHENFSLKRRKKKRTRVVPINVRDQKKINPVVKKAPYHTSADGPLPTGSLQQSPDKRPAVGEQLRGLSCFSARLTVGSMQVCLITLARVNTRRCTRR